MPEGAVVELEDSPDRLPAAADAPAPIRARAARTPSALLVRVAGLWVEAMGPGSAVAAVCGGAQGIAHGRQARTGEDQRHRRVAHRDGEDAAHDERSEGHDEMGGVPGVCHEASLVRYGRLYPKTNS